MENFFVKDAAGRTWARLVTRQKNTRPYVHRAGYHAAVSHYVDASQGINCFSGTCLNRQIRKNEKIRLQTQAKILKAAKKAVANGFKEFPPAVTKMPAGVYSGLPGKIKKNKLRTTRKNTGAPGGRGAAIHLFSERTRSIIKDKATAFYRAAGNRKIFCTLTFINEPASDIDAVKVLNKFLTVLRKGCINLQYLWIAERQTQNNNRIHFHLIINTRISIRRFNGLWVLQQYNAGIMHEKYSAAEIESHFAAGTMQEILNPVDVRQIKNIGKLSSYLTKYITKGNNKTGFGCRVWHCSRGVSALVTKQLVSQECIDVAKSYDNAAVDKKTGEILIMPAPMKSLDGRGYFYTVWRIYQPGRFLCYLAEMEQLNKWIISQEKTRDEILEYLTDTITPDKYRAHFLN